MSAGEESTVSAQKRGRCWKFGDNIPTDRLVKTKYVVEPMPVIVQHVLEDLNPRFPLEVQPGDVVVAGKHFGQSSGRAIAVKALKATGVGCVVAETFARTFYRNCFEVGLPALEIEGVSELVSDGDQLEVDVVTGVFRNLTTGTERSVPPADPFLLEMLAAGGLIKLAAARPQLFDPDGPPSGVSTSGLTEQVDVAVDDLPMLDVPGDGPVPTATQVAGEYERGDSVRAEMDPR